MKNWRPFLIVSLPRSRTFWLSHFLSYGDVRCLHEPSIHFTSLADLAGLLDRPNTGAADPMLTLLWERAKGYRQDLLLIAVRRAVSDVIASGEALGIRDPGVERLVWKIEAALSEAEKHSDTLAFDYSQLDSEEYCREIFERCTGRPFDLGWWRQWRGRNMQASLVDRARQMHDNRLGIRRVYGRFLDQAKAA